jgi:hypothetical protein
LNHSDLFYTSLPSLVELYTLIKDIGVILKRQGCVLVYWGTAFMTEKSAFVGNVANIGLKLFRFGMTIKKRTSFEMYNKRFAVAIWVGES